MRVFLDLATCHTPQAHSRLKEMLQERPFTPGMGEMCVWWKEMHMTGVAGSHRRKSSGLSLGLTLFMFLQRLLWGHILSVCWVTTLFSPAVSPPLSSPVCVAQEAGVKAGSPTCQALHIWRLRISSQERMDFLFSCLCVKGAQTIGRTSTTQLHECRSFKETLLPAFKVPG